jgi:hypothetical protein
MHATRFERMALTSLFVAGWVTFFSAAIAHAQPLYASPPPPQPPPTFNPSTPYTVPQSPETPVAPGVPNAVPRSEVVSPSVGSPRRAVTRSHRRAHEGRRSPRHRFNGVRPRRVTSRMFDVGYFPPNTPLVK